MTRLPSGTVTLVFTDIERSTRLLHRLGDVYGQALEEHRRLMRAAVTAAGGVDVEAQRALASHEWPDGATFRVRIGVHTGEPERLEDGYVGIDVHRASRIGDAGHGGQILVSDATRALVGDTVVLRELGEFRLVG